MSFQIFLQGKILGYEEFLVEGSAVEGRSAWASLLGEVLPRAMLAELGLSPMLLGLSGGQHFLVLIPAEMRGQADDFCRSANAGIRAKSGGSLRLCGRRLGPATRQAVADDSSGIDRDQS